MNHVIASEGLRIAFPDDPARPRGSSMFVACLRWATVWIALVSLLMFSAAPTAAQDTTHLGTNRLVFEPVRDSAFPDATGRGIVDYRGGIDESSRWRASFGFTGLAANATYTVVIRGRKDDADTDDGASDDSPDNAVCSFESDREGAGDCFWYLRGLERLDVVLLRAGDEKGDRVLQASRSGKRGSINTFPNRFSPDDAVFASQGARGDKR